MAFKEAVQALLKENSDRIALDPPTNCKSLVWEKFGVIHLDGKRCPLAACLSCKHVLHYRSCNGTSTLKAHKCPNGQEPRSALDVRRKWECFKCDVKRKANRRHGRGLSMGLTPLEKKVLQFDSSLEANKKADADRFPVLEEYRARTLFAQQHATSPPSSSSESSLLVQLRQDGPKPSNPLYGVLQRPKCSSKDEASDGPVSPRECPGLESDSGTLDDVITPDVIIKDECSSPMNEDLANSLQDEGPDVPEDYLHSASKTLPQSSSTVSKAPYAILNWNPLHQNLEPPPSSLHASNRNDESYPWNETPNNSRKSRFPNGSLLHHYLTPEMDELRRLLHSYQKVVHDATVIEMERVQIQKQQLGIDKQRLEVQQQMLDMEKRQLAFEQERLSTFEMLMNKVRDHQPSQPPPEIKVEPDLHTDEGDI